jgi:hypothetical protein
MAGLNVEDLIQLPRFDAAGAVLLGERLLQVANAEPELPRSLLRAKEALEDELAALRAAAAARLAAAAASGDPAALAEADRALDGCWTALFDWLTGFSKLPDGTPQAEDARLMLADLYPDGLSFILLPYETEWSQSDQRLSRIASEPLGERIRALGGEIFLASLAAAHGAYGKLLGLPRPTGAAPGTRPAVLHALESFASTLRAYALKVTANVEVDAPSTGVLAKRLLEPLLSWQTVPRSLPDAELTIY